MIPLIALAASFLLFVFLGMAGIPYFAGYHHALRLALAVMFVLTASAHWGAKRVDLVRMVPPSFKRPELWVTATGILEILGAAGLLIPATVTIAAIGLSLMLIAVFPANARAARLRLTIGGRPVPKLGIRIVIQLIFLACVLIAGFNLGAA
jgi:uncharacterized membrane protein